MKKLFFVGVLTLTTLISCQNEREESTTPNVEEKSEMAVNAVKQDGKDPAAVARPAQMEAFIDCHTNYDYNSGHSCVWVDGMQFNVSWTTVWSTSSSGAVYSTRNYVATQTSFCSCGG